MESAPGAGRGCVWQPNSARLLIIHSDTLEETYIQTEPFVFDNGTWNPFYNYSGYWTASEKLGGVGE